MGGRQSIHRNLLHLCNNFFLNLEARIQTPVIIFSITFLLEEKLSPHLSHSAFTENILYYINRKS